MLPHSSLFLTNVASVRTGNAPTSCIVSHNACSRPLALAAIVDETCTRERLSLAERRAQRVHACTFQVCHRRWRSLTSCAIHLLARQALLHPEQKLVHLYMVISPPQWSSMRPVGSSEVYELFSIHCSRNNTPSNGIIKYCVVELWFQPRTTTPVTLLTQVELYYT